MSAPLKHIPLAERDKNDPEQQLGTVLDVILSEFGKLGYKTVYGLLDAVNYGVPQFRERFVLIGSRDNEDIFLPFPTHFQMHQDPQYRWRTLNDTIRDLEYDCGECAAFSNCLLYTSPDNGLIKFIAANTQGFATNNPI